ncbi:MAG: dTDP-4-dehydrorhamnose 3-epimerase [Actinomycetota bacterium]
MTFIATAIQGSWLFKPKRFGDDRGYFQETFKREFVLDQTGIDFEVKQVNQSKSQAGVVRGVHWADVPPGQAKFVTVPFGEVWDVVVDLRVGSPTFGKWDAYFLSSETGDSLLIGNGLGHAFLALTNDTVVSYLCSEVFNPTNEHGIFPRDATLNISFDDVAACRKLEALSFSDKDLNAPSLESYLLRSGLPTWQ